MINRKCIHCNQPGGTGPRELRPYGPNGTDVCAECVLGPKAPEARKKLASKALIRQISQPGPLVLDAAEQAGPRPLKSNKC